MSKPPTDDRMVRMIVDNVPNNLLPKYDGDSVVYTHPDVGSRPTGRRVVFVNGMANSPEEHAVSALALSFVQMCTVIGVYNQSTSGWQDFLQCIGDKNQFDGPLSLSAKNAVRVRRLFHGMVDAEAARAALRRNPAQVALFNLLRRQDMLRAEIFAHSQGNLILSNALQAIYAVDGAAGIAGRVVHTFGSPAVNWPPGLQKREHGFTFDPVTWLAGFDTSWSISKVGMPQGSWNPITHAFLEYLKRDPAFVVNRYRVGGWGMTFNMDERGLADCLIEMGVNLERVHDIFAYLQRNHGSDSDDVAVLYVSAAMRQPILGEAIKSHSPLRDLLIRILSGGVVFGDERRAIAYLRD